MNTRENSSLLFVLSLFFPLTYTGYLKGALITASLVLKIPAISSVSPSDSLRNTPPLLRSGCIVQHNLREKFPCVPRCWPPDILRNIWEK